MSERYSRLFALPEDLYSVGSPVVIAAGALLKDNQTGKVIGQLKLRSISQKAIKAVKVKFHLFDTAGNPIGESVEHSYLDLNAARDSEFGQKSPIAVPEAKTRSYQAAVTEVVFADQSVWTSDEGVWESLEKPTTLSITDPELLKQYQMHYGSGAKYEAKEEKDLWHCTCGALNHEGETCHVCGHSLFELQTVEMEKLTAEKDARLAEAAHKAAEEQAATEAQKKKTAKILAIVLPTVCALVAIILLATKVMIPNAKYNDAVALMDAGSYEEAIVAFEAMDGYKDSAQKIKDCELAILEGKYNNAVALMEAGNYEEAASAFEALDDFKDSEERADEAAIEAKYAAAESLLAEGKTGAAAIAFGKIADYKDSRERSKMLWTEITSRQIYIQAGSAYHVGVRNDGTVVATGANQYGQCNVESWTDIVAVNICGNHTVGLRSDGTVVATGENDVGQCDVEDWTDIVAVEGSVGYTVGLRSDGTVVAVGDNEYGLCNVEDWTDIVAINHDYYDKTYGIRSDGTVVAVGHAHWNVKSWTDIVAISAGANHTVGLRSDGTVVAVGDNEYGQCDVENWTDIVAISAGSDHTVGLRIDGTVVAVGFNTENVQCCNVDDWTDIVSISAGLRHTTGLRIDGTVVVVGNNTWYNHDRTPWKDIVAINENGYSALGLRSDGTIVAVYSGSGLDFSDWTDIKFPD